MCLRALAALQSTGAEKAGMARNQLPIDPRMVMLCMPLYGRHNHYSIVACWSLVWGNRTSSEHWQQSFQETAARTSSEHWQQSFQEAAASFQETAASPRLCCARIAVNIQIRKLCIKLIKSFKISRVCTAASENLKQQRQSWNENYCFLQLQGGGCSGCLVHNMGLASRCWQLLALPPMSLFF